MASPKRITKIETQKRNSKRKSIYLDGEFAFGIDEELFFKFGLYEGNEINAEEIQTIIQAEEKKITRDRALRFLSYRARSEKEMRDKLADTGTHNATIDEIVENLKSAKLIDDRQFAMAFVHDKMTLKPVGPLLIKTELRKHKISDEIIEAAVEEAFREETPNSIAMKLLKKRYQSQKNKDWLKVRKRLSDFLARRGFPWDIIYETMQQFEIQKDEDTIE